MTARRALLIVIAVVLAVPAGAATGQAAGPDAVLVVDDNGEYTSIQAAVDAADTGDTVRVTPGTYREAVVISKNVAVVAPRGATLNGHRLDEAEAAFAIQGGAAPVVEGFTVTGYDMGVEAFSATGDWVVRNTTFREVGSGITAVYSTGDWRAVDVTIRNGGTGIEAGSSTGDWVVADTVIRNITEGDGVDAGSSSGNWTLRNVTVSNVDFVGVAASSSHGDWRLVNSTVRNALVGVGAIDASGDWLIRGSTIANVTTSRRYDFWQPPLTEGVAVDASGTNGSWTVRGSRFADIDRVAISAAGARPMGDARYNWFDNSGSDACTGNVDCGEQLATWPPPSPVPILTATPTTTDDNMQSSTTVADPSTPIEPTSSTDGEARASRTTTPLSGPSAFDPPVEMPALPSAVAIVALLATLGALGVRVR